MSTGYFISDDEMRKVFERLERYDQQMEDKTLDEKDRERALYRWQGVKRALRDMGFNHDWLYQQMEKNGLGA